MKRTTQWPKRPYPCKRQFQSITDTSSAPSHLNLNIWNSFGSYSLVKTTSGAWWSENCKGKPRNIWRKMFQASSQNKSQWQFPSVCPLSVLVNIITQDGRWQTKIYSYSLQISRIGKNWVTNNLWNVYSFAYNNSSRSLHAMKQDGHQSEHQHHRSIQLPSNFLVVWTKHISAVLSKSFYLCAVEEACHLFYLLFI